MKKLINNDLYGQLHKVVQTSKNRAIYTDGNFFYVLNTDGDIISLPFSIGIGHKKEFIFQFSNWREDTTRKFIYLTPTGSSTECAYWKEYKGEEMKFEPLPDQKGADHHMIGGKILS